MDITSPRDKKGSSSAHEEALTPELEERAYFSGLVLHITAKLGGVAHEMTWRHVVVLPGGFLRLYEVKKPQLFRGEIDMKNASVEVPHEGKVKKYDKIKLPPPLSKDTIIEGERAYIAIRTAAHAQSAGTGSKGKSTSAMSKVAEMMGKAASTTVFCVSSTRLDHWLDNFRRATKLGPIDPNSAAANFTPRIPLAHTPSRQLLYATTPATVSSSPPPAAPSPLTTSSGSASGTASTSAAEYAEVPRTQSPAEIFNSLAKARNAPPATPSITPTVPPLPPAPTLAPRPTLASTPSSLTLRAPESVPAPLLLSTVELSASPFESPFAGDLSISPFEMDLDEPLSAPSAPAAPLTTSKDLDAPLETPFDDLDVVTLERLSGALPVPWESSFLLAGASELSTSAPLPTPFYLEELTVPVLERNVAFTDAVFVDFSE